MRLRLTLMLLLVTALAGGSGLSLQQRAIAASPPAAGPAERTGDVIVRFRPRTPLVSVAGAVIQAETTATASSAGSGLVLLHPDAGQSVDDALAALRANPDVTSADADIVVKAVATPNDTYYNAPYSYQWNLPQIGLPAAWDTTTGGAGPVVAVIDTGVEGTHPELSGKLVAGKNFVSTSIGASSNAGGAIKLSTVTAHPYLSGDQLVVAGHSVAGVNGTWTIFVPRVNIASSTNAGGLVKITTSAAHGFVTGDQVMISGHSNGCSGTCPAVNGTWTITVVDATSFTLNASTYSGFAGGATGHAKEASWLTLVGSTFSSAGSGGTATEPTAKDDNSHGTFVAGIIAASSNNASGMAGVCWACKIMPVKVLDNTGSGSSFNVAQGIDWAVANGAKVVNLSLGATSGIPALQTSVDNAWNVYGAVVVAASGNDNGPVLFPAAYANAVAVGANDQAGARWLYTDDLGAVRGSNSGSELDLMAPGASVLSTLCSCNGNPGGFGFGSGTSFASPHVAGVVALMIASGTTDKATIVSRLKSTATDMGAAGFDNLTGWGRVNAAGAVVAADVTGPAASITAPGNGATVSGSLPFTATATDPSGIYRVRFYVDGAYQGFDATAPFATTWNTAAFTNGPHTLKIQAVDTPQNATDVTITVTVNNADGTPPTANITAPADGTTVSGSSVNFSATAADAGGIQKVRFYVDSTYLGYDGSAPYAKTWDTRTATNGTHTLKIQAIDNANNVTSKQITVTVNNADSTPPVVSLSAPADGATVSGAFVNIAATASDNTGVQKVRFWVDGTYLGYDSAAPYGRGWDSTSVANGAHVIQAQAVDQAGNVSAMSTVNITVSN
jgi:subtilisin family serine protease